MRLTMTMWGLLGAIVATAAGCELIDELDAGPLDAFVDAGPPASVSGQWRLSGDGRLKDCDDPRFNTDMLTLSSTLQVVQEDGTLRLADGVVLVDRFVFEDGTVREDRVRFTTLEEAQGQRIVLHFDGRYDALIHEIRGDFEGEGPGTCASSGSFRVEL